MNRWLIIILFLFSTNLVVYGQFEDYEKQDLKQKTVKKDTSKRQRQIVYGGDFGIQLGTSTLIKISPAVGRYFSDYFLLGASATYIYSSNKFYRTKGSIWGGSIFAEAYPLSFIVIHAEYEKLYIDFNYLTQAYWSDSYLVGLGYRQLVGKRGMVDYLILWDFNYTAGSLYTNPRFKILILF